MSVRSDDYWMARAIALAETAIGRTSPNPTVGAVVVKDGEVVGEGYHPGPGRPHAEVYALEAAGADAKGATLYVTLEPCSTEGRTPPCTDALVSAGLATVVYGTRDPNPEHRGRGLHQLEREGISTRQAGDQALLRDINRGFFAWMETGRPYVAVKLAVTLDGRITLEKGRGSQLTGPEAQVWAHRCRATSDAVLVGISTALIDDPLLTARPPEGCPRQPTRVVLDSEGRLGLDSQLVQTAKRVPVLVLTTNAHDPAWREALAQAGVDVAVLPIRDGVVDLEAALKHLGERGFLEIAVEPGPTLLASFLDSGLIDKIHLIQTTWTGGDPQAPRWFERLARERRPAARWSVQEVLRLGDDVLMTMAPLAAAPSQLEAEDADGAGDDIDAESEEETGPEPQEGD